MIDPSGEPRYVGRGGLKLRHALDVFEVDPRGLVCADFGCNIGGFTDCLLQAGAAKVYAVDTGYGALAWTLRNDPRVAVRERTNALHADAPDEALQLIAIDLAWTPQERCIPAALRWLRGAGRIITLIKPHYEAAHGPERGALHRGVLEVADAEAVLSRVLDAMPALGARVLGMTRSPIVGGGSKKNASGNTEYLALLEASGATRA